MCMTSDKSELSDTHLYLGEATKNGKYVHVMLYQNLAESFGPNCMILPIPSSVALSEENVMDTSSFKNVLKDISKASKVTMRSLSFGKNMPASAGAAPVQVFEKGSYSVILAESAFQIPKALKSIKESKRPKLAFNLMGGLSKLYSKNTFLVACWEGTIKPEPIMIWYEPTNPDEFFIPTMDAHDGNAPNLDARVDVDHIISVGSADPTKTNAPHKVKYSDFIPKEISDLLPVSVFGTQIQKSMQNGDFKFPVSSLMVSRKFPNLIRGGGILEAMFPWS